MFFISSTISWLKWSGTECMRVRIASCRSPLMIGKAKADRVVYGWLGRTTHRSSVSVSLISPIFPWRKTQPASPFSNTDFISPALNCGEISPRHNILSMMPPLLSSNMRLPTSEPVSSIDISIVSCNIVRMTYFSLLDRVIEINFSNSANWAWKAVRSFFSWASSLFKSFVLISPQFPGFKPRMIQ